MRHIQWASEAELASAFMSHQRALGLKVYPEVEADLLVVRPDGIMAVEAKLAPTLKVLSQAWKHRNKFQFIAVVVPTVFNTSDFSFFVDCCEHMGIGLYTIRKRYPRANMTSRDLGAPVFEVTLCTPATRREVVTPPYTLRLLNEDAEKFTVPGKPSPSGFSHWHAKWLKLARHVRTTPGCHLLQAYAACFPPALHKRTGLPRALPKNEIDFAKYYLRSGKCRFLVCDEDYNLSVTDEFMRFEATSLELPEAGHNLPV